MNQERFVKIRELRKQKLDLMNYGYNSKSIDAQIAVLKDNHSLLNLFGEVVEQSLRDEFGVNGVTRVVEVKTYTMDVNKGSVQLGRYSGYWGVGAFGYDKISNTLYYWIDEEESKTIRLLIELQSRLNFCTDIDKCIELREEIYKLEQSIKGDNE